MVVRATNVRASGVVYNGRRFSANLTRETSSSSIAAGCLDYCRMDTMLHMTCTQYTK